MEVLRPTVWIGRRERGCAGDKFEVRELPLLHLQRFGLTAGLTCSFCQGQSSSCISTCSGEEAPGVVPISPLLHVLPSSPGSTTVQDLRLTRVTCTLSRLSLLSFNGCGWLGPRRGGSEEPG